MTRRHWVSLLAAVPLALTAKRPTVPPGFHGLGAMLARLKRRQWIGPGVDLSRAKDARAVINHFHIDVFDQQRLRTFVRSEEFRRAFCEVYARNRQRDKDQST